ncbi:dienelactone hydrolase [Variovorax guangxiensis]|uniref:Dienelactone hydrolase n=2 Tax=Variovorax guangxiensis TaxID=1775474 RepID=A0A3S0Z2U8_9BURK|nr:dienelactone hydrolase [Variovorax guangxiensis]
MWGACHQAAAALNEDQLDVPVKISNAYGKPIEHAIKVTVFWDDRNPTPAPILILNHGRSADAVERANMGRARYSVASRYFVAQGFIVAVPTRIGYGVTGGEDIEDSGACNVKRYEPAYEAAAIETMTVLEAVRARPDADRTRSVLVGQSFGGTVAITSAAKSPEGVIATINFAGGGGGDPKNRPQRPCAPQLLERMFAQYGKTTHIPTLWIYTENDEYFGPTYPREWFSAFKDAGGNGEFVQFPPQGEGGGHGLFTKYPRIWQPKVQEFLHRVGLVASASGPKPQSAGVLSTSSTGTTERTPQELDLHQADSNKADAPIKK